MRHLPLLLAGSALFAGVVAVPDAQTPPQPAAQAAPRGLVTKGDFRFEFDQTGVSGLANPNDPFNARLTAPTSTARGGGMTSLGLILSYRTGNAGNWVSMPRGTPGPANPDGSGVTYATADPASPLKVVESYKTDGRVLDWTVDLEAKNAVEVGDLGISIPAQGPTGNTPADIFERGFLRHQFVSGAGSFFFYVRASGAPPRR